MQTNTRKHHRLFILGGVLLLFAGVIFLWPTSTASAQCGSQASSCKNCHEVQEQAPVNHDGTEWHESHAFGDFCEFCHAGNVQSTNESEAHTGMAAPLSDPEASCSLCHDDYLDLGQGYANILGIELGSSATPPSSSGGTVDSPVINSEANPPAQPLTILADTVVVDEADLIDFNKQYEETVLGIRDLNIGNVILVVLVLVILGGGGLFVSINEEWIHITTDPVPSSIDGYSKDSVTLLPNIEKLNDPARKALKKLLKKPDKAGNVFTALADLEEKNKE